MTELVSPTEAALARLAPTVEKARDFVALSQAANTARAYKADWAHFAAWCVERELMSLPATPATVALYLTDLADPSEEDQVARKVSTIQRRLSGIVFYHTAANHDSPADSREVRAVMRGIRRAKGTAPTEKQPATTEIIRAMVEQLENDLRGRRDRALLLVGFAGALRRSELVGLAVRDAQITREGIVLMIRRSKTDQEGQGMTRGIAYGSNPDTCPVRALQAWLEHTDIKDGPLFRSLRFGRVQPRGLDGRDVARIVKRAATEAGLDPTYFSGHSLRAGLATAAAAAGVSERAIMDQTGHKSLTVMRRYIRKGSLFKDNASAQVGL
ncbi:MAG: tyrosine-type recombinase/integrase [Chloroflexales bacterium]|nr:tyrosine-type recombinase/integrase [Chloroflexales bacterium]